MMAQTRRRPREALLLMLPPPRYPRFISFSLLHLMLRARKAHRCKAHGANTKRRHVSDHPSGAAFPGGAATLGIFANVALLSLPLYQL